MEYRTIAGIKAWAEDDRPREKMLEKGCKALSDAELLAIIIGSGTPSMTAVDLSKQLLANANNRFADLSRHSIDELKTIKGIGTAKAISIMAALEIGRRRRSEALEEKPKITSSQIVYELMGPVFSDLNHEEFWCLLLSRSNKVLHKIHISKGGIAGTVVDPKLIFKPALERLASAIIVCHNHPSGNLKPSDADISLTRKIKEAGKLLDIALLDHVIFTDNGYVSFADEGLL